MAAGRHVALLAIACAMMLKLLVPAGYMPVSGKIAVELCTGQGVQMMLLDAQGEHEQPRQHRGADAMPCAYSAFAAPTLSASDPVMVALAIVTVGVLGWRLRPGRPRVRSFALRPPGQAPPRLI